MSRRIAPIAVSILVLAGGIAAAGPPAGPPGAGVLDTSFGDQGVARLPVPSHLFGAAVQADGNLVATGQSRSRVAVVRFAEDGSLDHSFNGDGIYIGPKGEGHDVAIDSLGRILVAASTLPGGMTAIRLTPNGKPDSSFSPDDGIVVAGPQLPGGEGLDLALQGDTVVVAGAATTPEGQSVAVARFTDNGALDESFGSDGARIYGYGVSRANAVAIDSDGKIVLAGSRAMPGDAIKSADSRLVLAARLNRNGTPDQNFGNTDVPGLFLGPYQRNADYSAAFDVTVDPKDRPVLAGVALKGPLPEPSRSGSDAIAVRLTTAGLEDSSFGNHGVAYRLATANEDESSTPEPHPGAYGVALGGGGDIILGGYFEELGRKQLALFALDQDGHLDRSFGLDGLSTHGFDNENGKFSALAIGGNGGLFGVGDVADPFGARFTGLAAKYGGLGQPPRLPASVSLAPTTAENPVGTEHCVTATVADQNGAPLSEKIEVSFRVMRGNPEDESQEPDVLAEGSQATDTSGEARFCYIGQSIGHDTIRAGPKVRLASASTTWIDGSPSPELGALVTANPVTGTVLVNTPEDGGFVPIERLSEIPVGSVIDATNGHVRVSSAKKHGGRHTTVFSGSRFRVLHQYRQTGLTEIKLVDPGLRCHRARRPLLAHTRHRARRPLLAHGNHTRTVGKFGSGTVGSVRTVWLTKDRCDGTSFKVKGGVLAVRDFTRDRTVVLHAGEHYLAKHR